MRKLLTLLLVLAATPALAQNAQQQQPRISPKTQEILDLYVGPTGETLSSLSKAHRSVREISDWTFDAVADALDFKAGASNSKLLAVKPKFSEGGYKAYLAFLGAQPFAQALQAQQLSLSAIVNASPILIGQGATNGRYAWMFEMPIIMTANGVPGAPTVIRIQVGRNALGPEPHGVLIENWQVRQEDVQNPDKGSQVP